MGSTAEAHDRILRCPGAFDRGWNAMLRAAQEAPADLAYAFTAESTSDFLGFCYAIQEQSVRSVFLLFPDDSLIRQAIPEIAKVRKKFPSLRLAATKNVQTLIGLVLGAPIAPPRRAVIEIYNDCNLRCDFCWTHSPLREHDYPEDWLSRMLDPETIYRYVDELADYDMEMVELCAVGDPLFHPHVWEIIEHIKKRNLPLRLSTNGTLITQKRADQIVELGVEELFMNISSGDRQHYHLIHNVSPTIFYNLERNLSYLAEKRAATGKHRPTMRIINVITEKNLLNIDNIIEFGQRIRADYLDFRKVWVHVEFLRQLDYPVKKLETVLTDRDRLLEKMKASGIDSNLEYFFKDLENDFWAKWAKPTPKGQGAEPGAPAAKRAKTTPIPRKLREDEINQPVPHFIPEEPMPEYPRGTEHTQPPCSVAYQFTLLDINHRLRYCCRGDRQHDKYVSISKQWESPRYIAFRNHWKNVYRQNRQLCEGCPHIGENQYYGEELKRLKLEDLV